MKITMNRKDNELIVALQGRLDSLSALDLDKKLDSELDGIEKLIFDFEKLEYISSAGLRILLSVYSTMESRGKMIVRNINRNVKSVFEITGFLAFSSFLKTNTKKNSTEQIEALFGAEIIFLYLP